MLVDGDWVRAGNNAGSRQWHWVAAIMSVYRRKNCPSSYWGLVYKLMKKPGWRCDGFKKEGYSRPNTSWILTFEDDHELTIGCAGGIDVTAITRPYDSEPVPDEHSAYAIKVSGLTGGHSGMDIHGRGNANKLLNRLLVTAQDRYNVRLCSFDGGSLRNDPAWSNCGRVSALRFRRWF